MNRNPASLTPSLIGALMLALGCAVAATPASAQSTAASPVYGGISLANSNWRDSLGGVSSGSAGTGYKVYGGYQFTPNFALEAGAVGLGKVSDAVGENKARGIYLDAVGQLPLDNQWSLLGRVGVVDAKTISTTLGSDRGWGTKLGVGAQYQLSKSVALRGEFERYRLNAFDTHPNVNQLLLGVKFGF